MYHPLSIASKASIVVKVNFMRKMLKVQIKKKHFRPSLDSYMKLCNATMFRIKKSKSHSQTYN